MNLTVGKVQKSTLAFQFVIYLVLGSSYLGFGQNLIYIKAGPSVGFQQWSSFQGQTQPLYRYHGSVMFENADPEGKFGLMGQIGMHLRGSGMRFPSYTLPTGQQVDGYRWANVFGNISGMLGLKAKKPFGGQSLYYYGMGVRGEFTAFTKLEIGNLPQEGVRKFNYGLWLGGGFEFPVFRWPCILEISISPDVSKQVIVSSYQYRDPISGIIQFVPSQRQTNISFEVSFGARVFGQPKEEDSEDFSD